MALGAVLIGLSYVARFFRATINSGLKSPTALRKVNPEGTEAVSMRDLMANFLQHPALTAMRAGCCTSDWKRGWFSTQSDFGFDLFARFSRAFRC